MLWQATILGETASKSNGRRNVWHRGTSRSIKSEKALNYVESFILQARQHRLTMIKAPFTCDVILFARIFYASKRPDLDEQLIMDCLQKAGILKNDRQIKEKHIYHDIDRKHPRAEIELYRRVEDIKWPARKVSFSIKCSPTEKGDGKMSETEFEKWWDKTLLKSPSARSRWLAMSAWNAAIDALESELTAMRQSNAELLTTLKNLMRRLDGHLGGPDRSGDWREQEDARAIIARIEKESE